ncbi:MAG TPA: YaeQ family protein [Candidatus Binatia bacterium]|nr:YaeQ family protein [Candidatus Binatia bacterium]
MALGSTIFKVALEVADMDRGYYGSHALTVARHPSETSERMMIRVLAFALRAHERLRFGGGVSTPKEPDLWRHTLDGRIEEWIELGQPDVRRVRKACGRADEVRIYTYGGMKAATWWEQSAAELSRHENLHVHDLPAAQTAALAELASSDGRGIELQCNVQDGEAYMIGARASVCIAAVARMG